MARKLKEEKVIQLARDEGRRQGIEEGIARGRAIGYEEGRAAGFARGKSSAAKEYMSRYRPEDFDMPGPPIRISASTSDDSSSSPSKPSAPVPPTPVHQGTPPEDIRIASPVSYKSGPPAGSQPTNARSSVHSFTQITADYPQDDGWIPKIDDDGRVRLPPPHELAMSPVASPPAAATPALMVPPPLPMQPPPEPEVTTPTEPTTPGRPRYRRRRSTESNSTTMSQFDILGPPPVATSGKGTERPNVLSAIVEEKERSSTVSTPQQFGNVSASRSYHQTLASSLTPTSSLHIHSRLAPVLSYQQLNQNLTTLRVRIIMCALVPSHLLRRTTLRRLYQGPDLLPTEVKVGAPPV